MSRNRHAQGQSFFVSLQNITILCFLAYLTWNVINNRIKSILNKPYSLI